MYNIAALRVKNNRHILIILSFLFFFLSFFAEVTVNTFSGRKVCAKQESDAEQKS